MSFDREIDHSTGAQLGIVSISSQTHEQAKKCVAGEQGKKLYHKCWLGVPASEDVFQ